MNRFLNPTFLLMCISIWGLLKCQPIPSPHPPLVDVDASPGIIPDASYDGPISSLAECACGVLEWLGCEEGLPTKTESCPHFYTRVNNFPGMKLNGVCICKARTTLEVRACGVKCK